MGAVLFPLLISLSLLAVLASLGLGLFAMARGREGDARLSNRMMRWRVGLQALALVVFAVAMMVSRG